MKKILIFFLFFLTSCNHTSYEYSTTPSSFKALGSSTSNQTWVYLSGLLADFIPDQMEELKILDILGKQLNIKFLAMVPKNRCVNLNNRLCWPQENKKELLQTYQEILKSLENQTISGYIGFSNGGFFLDKLAQLIEFKKPIISIGAAGPLLTTSGPQNTIYLLIGKQDEWHYEHAINFYNQSQKSNLTIHLIEHDEGHIIPTSILRNLLEELSK